MRAVLDCIVKKSIGIDCFIDGFVSINQNYLLDQFNSPILDQSGNPIEQIMFAPTNHNLLDQLGNPILDQLGAPIIDLYVSAPTTSAQLLGQLGQQILDQLGNSLFDQHYIAPVVIAPPPIATQPTYGFLRLPADSTLSGHRAVIQTVTGISYADNTIDAHYGRVLGITANAGIQGDLINVVTDGELDGFASFTVDLPVYLSSLGVVTQNPPTTGFIQQLGIAISSTRVFVQLQTPISLI